MKKNIKYKVISWLNGKSELYSNMLEEEITRRKVILLNIAAVALIVGVFAAERYPLTGLLIFACVGLVGKRLNKDDK